MIFPTLGGHIRRGILALRGVYGTEAIQAVQPGVQARSGPLGRVRGKPKAQIARQLGIRVNQLRKWKLEFEAEERAGGAPKQTPATQDDPAELRCENTRLREEIEILKKAAIYFARGSK